jgi:7tm Chemosensory receptor
MQFWMKVFHATGTSLKVSLKKSSLWIFSSASICVYIASIIAACVFCDYSNVLASNKHVGILLTSLFWGTCFGSSLAIFLISAKVKVERKFWKTVNEIERIFESELGQEFDCGNLNKVCGMKVAILLTGFLLSEVSVIFFLHRKGFFVLMNNSLLHFMPQFMLKMFVIKNIFYVEVLNVCLMNIQLKLKKKQHLRLGDLKVLKKVYSLCWELSVMLEDIFGWTNVYLTVVLLVSLIFHGNNICYNFAKGTFNFSQTIPLLVTIVNIFVPLTTCEKCVNTSKSIVHLAFSINLPTFHEDVTDFVLQIMHQRIEFEPKTFFAINHELIVGVSIDFLMINNDN